jgi:hypothetical protein
MVELCANSNHPMMATLADTKADIMAMANAFRAASVRYVTLRQDLSSGFNYKYEFRLSTFDCNAGLLLILQLLTNLYRFIVIFRGTP